MIINPWFFYVLQVSSSIKAAIIISGAAALVLAFLRFVDDEMGWKHKSIQKPLLIGIVLCGIACILPSRDTLLLMKASEFVTYDNVQLTVDAFKSAIDYAASIVQ